MTLAWLKSLCFGSAYAIILHLLKHLARARASQPFAQGAIWVDFLVTDQTLVSITNRIQSATTAFDALVHKDHAKRHAQHDQ